MSSPIKFYPGIKCIEINVGNPDAEKVVVLQAKRLNFFEWITNAFSRQKTWIKLEAKSSGKTTTVHVKTEILFNKILLTQPNSQMTKEELYRLSKEGSLREKLHMLLTEEEQDQQAFSENTFHNTQMIDQLKQILEENENFVNESEKLLNSLQSRKELSHTLLRFHSRHAKIINKYCKGMEGAEATNMMLSILLAVAEDKKPEAYNALTTFIEQNESNINLEMESMCVHPPIKNFSDEYIEAIERMVQLINMTKKLENSAVSL